MSRCWFIPLLILVVYSSCTEPQTSASDPPALCPEYTQKEDVQIGNPENLPEGFFVFDRDTIPGLYKSPLGTFRSSLIPDTRTLYPRSISLSDDGRWIFFVDSRKNVPYLIQANGCHKTAVPTSEVSPGTCCPGGFYRNSPFGNEIFFLVDSQELHALHVTFTEDGAVFGNTRSIARLSSLRFNPKYSIQYAVSLDQIFGDIGPVINDSATISRTGFLTIPDNGNGIATDDDIYRWADDDYRYVEGCGHTMSFDGQFAAANAGPHFSPSSCIPTGHKGFYVVPFRRVGDPPLNLYDEHYLKFGTSLNWCPEQYRSGDHNFWGWYFTNSNVYIAGRMISTRGKSCGWIVDWRKNTWTTLCPLDSNIRIQQLAIHIGAVDTGTQYIDVSCQGTDTTIEDTLDEDNPCYRVISPNGGELFHIGEQCTVKVTSLRPGDAVLYLCLEKGQYNVLISTSHSFDPQTDSLFVIEIPDTFDIYGERVSALSDECMIRLADYTDDVLYYDESDGYFKIIP